VAAETGKWKLETGNSKMETGKWKLETGKWKLEAASRALSVVRCPLLPVTGDAEPTAELCSLSPGGLFLVYSDF
jgi:hypothetical protein